MIREARTGPSPLGTSRARAVAGGLLGCVGIGGVYLADTAAQPDLVLSNAYLVVIAAVAWWAGTGPGLACAGMATLASGLAQPPGDLTSTWVMPAVLDLSAAWVLGSLHAALFREQALARTDPVTGLPNRRAFEERVRAALARAGSRPLTAVCLDLDGFKQVNDRLGHDEGDMVLREVGRALAATARSADLVARHGGDEFAVLMEDTDELGARALLARLHEALDAAMAAGRRPVTFSIGAITFRGPPRTVREVMQLVDERLYDAKHGGKARLVHVTLEADRKVG